MYILLSVACVSAFSVHSLLRWRRCSLVGYGMEYDGLFFIWGLMQGLPLLLNVFSFFKRNRPRLKKFWQKIKRQTKIPHPPLLEKRSLYFFYLFFCLNKLDFFSCRKLKRSGTFFRSLKILISLANNQSILCPFSVRKYCFSVCSKSDGWKSVSFLHKISTSPQGMFFVLCFFKYAVDSPKWSSWIYLFSILSFSKKLLIFLSVFV